MNKCYIDGAVCGGARFSFCDDCKRAQRENAEGIANAKTPAEVTAAHITHIYNMEQWTKDGSFSADVG